MKKIITLLILVLLAIPLVLAMLIPAADKAKENAKADNSLVIEKVEIEGVEHLTLTPPGLEKIVFIHYKKGFAKPPWAGGGKPDKGTKCYDFLGRGVKWKELPVSYVIHPDLEAGAISASAETWDDATLEELFSDSYELDSTVSWDGWKNSVPDGRNELLFGDYPQEGVIAVAVVWGYFSGPPSTRKIIAPIMRPSSAVEPGRGDTLEPSSASRRTRGKGSRPNRETSAAAVHGQGANL